MRLSNIEIQSILKVIDHSDTQATTYLFGSRVDDSKRGGDIDILVISDIITSSKKLDLLIELKNEIGDQKIDLLIKTQEQFNQDSFCQSLKLSKLTSN